MRVYKEQILEQEKTIKSLKSELNRLKHYDEEELPF